MRHLFERHMRLRRLKRGGETTFQGFWHGPPLGALRGACLRSFIEHGHRFHVYAYEPIEVPPGVERKDANRVIPREEMFRFRNPYSGLEDLGPFSDLFRFRLLSTGGGWWCDIDTFCLSPDIPEVDSAWAQELPEIDEGRIGTGQMALRSGSQLSERLYSECLALSREPLKRREALGPRLLTRVIAELELPPSRFGSAATFYPVRWIEAFKLWLPQFYDEVCEKVAGAMFLSLYQSLPHYLGLDLEKSPPAGSYLDLMGKRFGIDDDGARRHDPDDVVRSVRRFLTETGWAMQELEVVGGESTMRALGLR
jgi:hypothetical protein